MLHSNRRLFVSGLWLYPFGLKSIFFIIFSVFIWGCRAPNDDQHYEQQSEIRQALEGRLLATGPNDIEILASPDTNDQIKVGVLTPSSLSPLKTFPPELSFISDVYGIEADRQIVASQDGWFAISFPLPPGVDPKTLVLAMWTPSESDFTPEYNVPDEEHATEGYWHVLDGEIASGRFYAAFYALENLEYLFALAEGEWFGPSSIHHEKINNNTAAIQQGLDGDGSIRLAVQCEHTDSNICTEDQRNIFAAYFVETMREFANRSIGNMSFPKPHLRKPLFSDADYKVFLRMIRPRNLATQRICRLSGLTGGVYYPLSRKIITCIWPKSKAAPTIEIKQVQLGTMLEINIDDKRYVVTVGPEEDEKAIAGRFVEMIQNDPPIASMIKSPAAESFGNLIALNWGSGRDSVPTVDVYIHYGAGAIGIIDFEYSLHQIGTHEYFHALQNGGATGPRLSTFQNKTYQEGAAVAAERARYTDGNILSSMQRNTTRRLRQLDTPLFRNGEVDQLDYRSQDFYIFVGLLLRTFDQFENIGLEWVIPLLADRGSLEAHRNTMALYGLSLSSVYSAFARNQFFEKSLALDSFHHTWKEPCAPQWEVFTRTSGRISVPYQGSVHEETISLSSYSSKAMEITFDPAHHGNTYIIEAEGNEPWTMTTIYPPQSVSGGCTSKFGPISRKVVNIAPGADTVYILISATETDGMANITIRPATTKVKLHLRDDEIRVSNRPIQITGEYEAEAGPVTVEWLVNGQVIETQSYSDPAGDISYSLHDRCLLGSTSIEVRIVDADNTQAWDSATIQMTSENTMLGIVVSEGYSCGSAHELPLEAGSLPAVMATGFIRGCGQGLSPNGLRWQAFLPDGTIKTDFGATLPLSEDDFKVDNSYGNITLQLSHDDIIGIVQKTLRPCVINLPAYSSNGACTPHDMCFVNTEIGPDEEVRRLQEKIDIIMTYEYRIARALNGAISDPFPLAKETIFPKLENYLDVELYAALVLISDALNAGSSSGFSQTFDKARHLVATLPSEAERKFALTIIALVENHVYFYSDLYHGGAGGWNDYSFIPGWTQMKPVDPIETADFAFRYALSAWIDLYDRSFEFSLTGKPLELDDPNTLDRIVQVGTDGAALEITGNRPED